jgi:hypothetical protein
VKEGVYVADGLGCQARRNLFGDYAGAIAPHRGSGRVDGRVAGLGDLASCGFRAVGGALRPVFVHRGVVIALDATVGEQLRVKL